LNRLSDMVDQVAEGDVRKYQCRQVVVQKRRLTSEKVGEEIQTVASNANCHVLF